MVPYLSEKASSDGSMTSSLAASVAKNDASLFKWYIGGTSFAVDWADPSALQIIDDNATVSWENSSGTAIPIPPFPSPIATRWHSLLANPHTGVISLPTANAWTLIIIQTTLSVPHPIHLHGHDFYQLAQGTGTYSSSTSTLNTANPPRRDVTMLPASGYVVIAFQADNPGVWLCHCHIGWHTEEGFALQFVERESEIGALYDEEGLREGCEAWEDWVSEEGVEDEGSGV